MSLSLLKKTAILMGDLQVEGSKNQKMKRTNQMKLTKLSSKEKKTRLTMEAIRKHKNVDNLQANVERIKKLSTRMDKYSKKALENDLVRKRIFSKTSDLISLKDEGSSKDAGGSVFTEEDFERFEQEYQIKNVRSNQERKLMNEQLGLK